MHSRFLPHRNHVSLIPMINSENEALLKEIVHYGPVTALKFDGERLFVGYGPVLKLFQISAGTTTHLWLKQVFKRNKIHAIAVCAESGSVAVCGSRSFTVVDANGTLASEKAINEWIMAIEFVLSHELLLLNSHNQVLRINISGQAWQVLETIHCDEKSILYSGSIHIIQNDVYVAAGTVMDGVLVWDLKTRQIKHHLTDHEGSIFAVTIDAAAEFIVSCSDDRSIKAYRFATGELLASGWGHGSRIWSLLFGATNSDRLQIVSMGEDCSTRVWEYVGSPSLECTKSFEHCHEGKHIWSGDADLMKSNMIVTGGADGKVRLLDTETRRLKEFLNEEIASKCGFALAKKECIKQFVQFPSIALVLLITSTGRLCFFQHNVGWTCLNIEPIADFISLQGHPELDSAVAVTQNGRLLMLTFELGSLQPVQSTWHEQPQPTPKFINALSTVTSNAMYILIDSPVKGSSFIVQKVEHRETFHVSESFELTKPTDCVFTPTVVHFDPVLQILFVGSRHANLAVYNLSPNLDRAPYLARKVCPGDTITSISPVVTQKAEAVVVLTVRDGIYSYIRFKTTPSIHHEIIHQNKFTKGSVEGSFIADKMLFLYGFRSSAFYLWNEAKQIEVFNEYCGGAHRQWQFCKDYKPSNQHSYFAYVNKSGLAVSSWTHRFGIPNQGLVTTGTHGREIRSVAISEYMEQNGSRLLVSAAEDATVKVGSIDATGSVKYHWTMNNHISGLQTVKFASSDYFVSSAANEELLVWKIDRYEEGLFAVKEQGRLPVSGDCPDLRIMDFCTMPTSQGFFIAAVFSNSVVQLFSYNTSSGQLTLIAKTVYSQFCLLNVEFLESAGQLHLCVGATDGCLTIWDITECLNSGSEFSAPIVKQQLHQCALKAFAVIRTAEGWDVVTGGDDNALIHSQLKLMEGKMVLEIVSFSEKAASATITGIVSVGNGQVFVTSVDQIVRQWDYTNGLTLKAANYTTVADTGCCAYSPFESPLVVVGGAGLSVFQLDI